MSSAGGESLAARGGRELGGEGTARSPCGLWGNGAEGLRGGRGLASSL